MATTINTMPHQQCETIHDYIFKGLDKHIGVGQPGEKVCAVLDLNECRDDYMNKLNRRRHRMWKKSAGFSFEEFNYKTFVPDIVSINTSKEVRAGGAMKAHYLKSVEEKGGYPKQYYQPEPKPCEVHSTNNCFGVFRQLDGYKQGDVVTGKQLLAYAILHAAGDIVMYSWVIGHGDYLDLGIMTKLQVGVVRWCLSNSNRKWLLMGAWSDGGEGSGLQTWKQEHLFKPSYLQR
jgi:hypothetical protein